MAMITSFVLITCEPSHTAELAEQMVDLPNVAEVYSVAGEFDLVAIVRVREHEELADVVTHSIARLPGIIRTRSHIAFRAYSKHDLESMWSLGT